MPNKIVTGKKAFIPVLFFILSGVVLSVALWGLWGAIYTEKPKTMLRFTPEIVQFGSVSQGIEHGKASVSNVSTKPVEIKAVTRGCDCSEVFIKQGELLPGEQREITFQWDTRGRRGDNAISINVIYTVENDSTERIAPLVIEANVVPDFEIIPAKLEFTLGQQNTQQLALVGTGGNQVAIKEILIHYPAFSTVILPDQQHAAVSFVPDSWTDGTKSVQAQILTTSDNEPVFILPIYVHANDGR